jgi:hypothetical protein
MQAGNFSVRASAQRSPQAPNLVPQKMACEAFSMLQALFRAQDFSLRSKNYHETQQSFEQIKQEVETVLNESTVCNRLLLIREFNRIASVPIRSSNDIRFEVFARTNHVGSIELLFLDS